VSLKATFIQTFVISYWMVDCLTDMQSKHDANQHSRVASNSQS